MTGVQRTVYEIAERYYKRDSSDVGFFVYDDYGKEFYEIDFSTVYEKINTPMDPYISKGEGVSVAKKISKKIFRIPTEYYKGMSDDTKDKIPESVITFAKLSIKGSEKIARTILHYVRVSRANRRSKKRVVSSGRRPGRRLFEAGDTVVVLGASWDSKTKIFDITRLKSEVGFRYVQLIHDVIPSFHPHLFGSGFAADFDTRIFESITSADHLFCNSKATMEELKRFCNLTRIVVPPIKLIRLGDDYAQSANPIRPKCSLSDNEPFILCVGTYEIRKNHMLLYYAVKEAVRRGVEIPKIVIIGRPGWLVGDLTYIINNDPQVAGRIQYLGGVSDDEKTWLFQHCSFTIFPAMFEGWGLPVGESLYYGKPCLSSNVSSMPEIGGDLVDYFSPYDSGECLDKIIEYSNSEVLSKKHKAIGDSYKEYTWDDTFRQVVDTIEKL